MNEEAAKKLHDLGTALAELEDRCTCPDCKALIGILVGVMLEAMSVVRGEVAS